MKLYTFEVNQQRRVGAELDGQLVDLTAAYGAFTGAQGPKAGALRMIPTEMASLVRLGPLAMDAARETVAYMKKRPAVPVGEQLMFPFEAVKVLPPIPRPGKILCVRTPVKAGSNLNIHPKLPGTVIGPNEVITWPSSITTLGFRPGIGVVIGKKIKAAEEGDVASAIFGYTILNDVFVAGGAESANAFLAGNYDSFCPMGPCVVTVDEISVPENLQVRTAIDCELAGGREAMEVKFTPAPEIAALSKIMALEPGDIISFHEDARAGLITGTVPTHAVSIEVEGVGRLENTVRPA